MNKTFRIFAGLAIGGVCLWLVFKDLDWTSLSQALRQARWSWFVPISLVYLSAHLLRCVRWSVLLSPVKKISAWTLFPFMMFGFLVNNILPARTGELARAFAASQKTDLPTSTFLGSIALERLTDLIGLSAVMMIAATAIPMDKLPLKKVALVFVVGLVLVAIFLMVARKIQKQGALSASRWQNKLSEFLDHLIQGFSSLKSPAMFFKVTILSITIWMIESLTLMLGAHAFGLDLKFNQANAVMSGISFGVMIPGAPGFIGTYEMFGRESMRLLGISAEVAVPFLLSFHFFQMLVSSVFGVPTLFKVGLPAKK